MSCGPPPEVFWLENNGRSGTTVAGGLLVVWVVWYGSLAWLIGLRWLGSNAFWQVHILVKVVYPFSINLQAAAKSC